MEAINIAVNDRRRAGVSRPEKRNPKTDMTPMVDLGFLLISFFVMTTELSKPRVASLNMPAEGPPIELGNSNALTVLLAGNDNVYYYHGNWREAVAENDIIKTSLNSPDGLRKVIIEKKEWLDAHDSKEGRNGLMMLIKSTQETPYKNVIDVLDETMINDVRKYALVKMEVDEAAWIKERK
ncbi:MAG: biopolymer transporter ExbD [Chitinophagaceae bacterium]